MPNSFASLPRPLRVIAHDLDRGDEVLFGEQGFDHVPITRACTASMALPPFFSPVRIGERYYIDAGAAQVRGLEAAARAQARAVVIVNPMVPVRSTRPTGIPTGHGERPSLRDKGAMWVANQAHRISLRALLAESIERLHRETRMQVILIEPDPTDTLLFMYNPASFAARRAILEQAYRTTRERVAAWPLARLSLMPQALEGAPL
jgi:predicted acylesterase/phospholipase RssA